MKLSDYLTEHDLTYREFAARCGRSVFQVHRWATGRRVPDVASAVAIERATEGRVTPADFVQQEAA